MIDGIMISEPTLFFIAFVLGWLTRRLVSLGKNGHSIPSLYRIMAQNEYAKDGLREILDVATTIDDAQRITARTLDKIERYEAKR